MQAATPTPGAANTPPRWYPRRVIVATLVVVLIATGFYLLYLFSNVLFVLFVAAVLATAIRPAVLWLERHHVPQWLGILLIYTLTALFTLGLIAALAPLLIAQLSTLVLDVPEYYSRFRAWIGDTPIAIIRAAANRLPPEITLSLPQSSADTSNISAVTEAVAYVRGFGWSLFGGIAIALITFFWIVDREQIVRTGLLLVPLDQRRAARDLWDTLEEKVGAFVRGQVLLCVSIGLLSTAAFLLIGIPNALLLGVLAGILEAVPYIGPIATALFAVTLTLAQSPGDIWWVIGACTFIQQIENAILVPRIMDRAVGVNAVVTLLAIAAFGTLLGVGGAIMAIPLAVIIQVLIERLLLNMQQQLAVEIVGRDQVALLRYQAQDLAQDLRERIRNAESQTDDDLLEEDLEAAVGELDQLLQTVAMTDPSMPDARLA